MGLLDEVLKAVGGAVDKTTPNGQIPAGGILDTLSGFLKKT